MTRLAETPIAIHTHVVLLLRKPGKYIDESQQLSDLQDENERLRQELLSAIRNKDGPFAQMVPLIQQIISPCGSWMNLGLIGRARLSSTLFVEE